MKKILSYRDKLLELSRIYNISEIQNYIKRKKNLTTHQIEHILKKNNVPIPKDLNVSFFKKSISNPISKAGKEVSGLYSDTTDGVGKFFKRTKKGASGFYDDTTGGVGNFFVRLWRNSGNIGIGILNTFPKLFSTVSIFISNAFVDTFSSFYTSEVEKTKTNKLVKGFGVAVFVCAIGVIFFTLKENFDENNTTKLVQVEKDKPKKIEKQIEVKKKIEKELQKKEEEKQVKKPEPAKEKSPSQVTELVLPNLNIKTETVLSLFEDVEYDLKTVRYQKKVKPIYFTQFPKDLDEIKDTKLKKETFIKIVLPLVVAENEKILNDKIKLKRITSKKMTSDKEKSWLRLKLREYKVKNSDISELDKRMDIIPVSIALAQAAKESGWGTSRFALEGNAIFGQWTWTGQGIEPLNKGKHEGHKILRFPILRASVKAYQNNLNTHKGYSEFREKRHSIRKRNKSIKGLALTDTLDRYAQTGKEYTDILEQIIKQNNLSDFETVQLTNSVVKKDIQL
tara:strand:- start:1058 stop:2584 length:1527 start_codon:yes stop_codon:yes gene_type:complete